MRLDLYIAEHKKSSSVPVNGLRLIVRDSEHPSSGLHTYTVNTSPSEKLCDFGKFQWYTGSGEWVPCEQIDVVECLDGV